MQDQGTGVRTSIRRYKEEEDRSEEFYLLCGSVEISIEEYFNRRSVLPKLKLHNP